MDDRSPSHRAPGRDLVEERDSHRAQRPRPLVFHLDVDQKRVTGVEARSARHDGAGHERDFDDVHPIAKHGRGHVVVRIALDDAAGIDAQVIRSRTAGSHIDIETHVDAVVAGD